MIYKLLKRYLKKLFRDLDIDASFDNGVIQIVLRLNNEIVFKHAINLNNINR